MRSLAQQGEQQLAERVARFVEAMQAPQMDRELIVKPLLEREKARERAVQLTR